MLNSKGDSLAMIKALAAGEYEETHGVAASYRLTWIQRATDSGVGWEMSDISGHLELWESRLRE